MFSETRFEEIEDLIVHCTNMHIHSNQIQVKEIESFVIVYKYKDRFTRPFKRTLTMLTKMFGNFWTNVVIVVNFWSFKKVNMPNVMYIFSLV